MFHYFSPLQLCLRKKTLKHFLDVLKTKFDTLMNGVSIANVYQRNKKGLKFLLDDDLLEHLENHQIFDIDLQERLDEPEKFDMTITEVQAWFFFIIIILLKSSCMMMFIVL